MASVLEAAARTARTAENFILTLELEETVKTARKSTREDLLCSSSDDDEQMLASVLEQESLFCKD